jgi:hypothetical protein
MVRFDDEISRIFERVDNAPTYNPVSTQFPRLIIQNFNLAYDFWVFEFNLAYDPWGFEFKICAQFTIVRILHCGSHPTVQKPKLGP